MWFLLKVEVGTSVAVGTSVVALAITGMGRGVVMEIEAGQVCGESVVKPRSDIRRAPALDAAKLRKRFSDIIRSYCEII